MAALSVLRSQSFLQMISSSIEIEFFAKKDFHSGRAARIRVQNQRFIFYNSLAF